jgi:hypothetical protein
MWVAARIQTANEPVLDQLSCIRPRPESPISQSASPMYSAAAVFAFQVVRTRHIAAICRDSAATVLHSGMSSTRVQVVHFLHLHLRLYAWSAPRAVVRFVFRCLSSVVPRRDRYLYLRSQATYNLNRGLRRRREGRRNRRGENETRNVDFK